MIAVLGFIALHLVLVALGTTVLWVVGLVDFPFRGRSVWPAIGPAYVIGVALLMPWLVLVLLLHLPFTINSAVAVAGLGIVVLVIVGRRRGRGATIGRVPPSRESRRIIERVRGLRSLQGLLVSLAGALVAWGAFALARAPTVGDDASIWSLRGLTLTFYDKLQPEIFLNPGQSGAHPVYPLLQPIFEALVSRAMGHPEPGFFHAELWLLFAASVWTGGFLIWRRAGIRTDAGSNGLWLVVVVLLAVIPVAVNNVAVGDADTTGSVYLALGVLCIGLWLDRDANGYLALAAVMLTAAASTKDEDLLGSAVVVAVLLVGTLAAALFKRRRWPVRSHVAPAVLLAIYFAALILPWRLWLHAHHFTDSVQPPLPLALEPGYLLGRGQQLQQTITSMLQETEAEWNWLVALFVVVCGICLATGRARRVAAFYLATFCLVVLSLVWLYTTTSVPLAFLLPTSMNRTVTVFMAMTPLAIAHLLSAAAPRTVKDAPVEAQDQGHAGELDTVASAR